MTTKQIEHKINIEILIWSAHPHVDLDKQRPNAGDYHLYVTAKITTIRSSLIFLLVQS